MNPSELTIYADQMREILPPAQYAEWAREMGLAGNDSQSPSHDERVTAEQRELERIKIAEASRMSDVRVNAARQAVADSRKPKSFTRQGPTLIMIVGVAIVGLYAYKSMTGGIPRASEGAGERNIFQWIDTAIGLALAMVLIAATKKYILGPSR